MRPMLLPLAPILLTSLVLLAVPVFASDGVLEINQTCAVSSGCFDGDAAGFPVTLSASVARSFRLTSDLVVPDANTTAVAISASDLSLDLGGFSIRGPNACSFPPVTCSSNGSGVGVEILAERVRVANGSVTGMGDVGILGSDPSLADVTGIGHVVEDVRVSHNGEDGIRLEASLAIVRGCTVLKNGQNGIFLPGANGMVTENVVSLNGTTGINVNAGNTVARNTSNTNGGNGINALSGSMVEANNLRGNTLRGLVLGASASYRDNSIANNAGGTVSGGVNAGGNACNGTTTCP